jgi:membrane-associated phospholipid phosphatase
MSGPANFQKRVYTHYRVTQPLNPKSGGDRIAKLRAAPRIALLAVLSLTFQQCLSHPAYSNSEPTPKTPVIHALDDPLDFWLDAGAIGLGLFFVDKPLQQLAQDRHLHSRAGDSFFNDGAVHLGEVWPYVGAFGFFSLDGLLSSRRRGLLTAGEVAVSPAIAHAIAGAAKKGFGRLRPFQSSSPYKFFKGSDSFISGHAITAFTLATVIAKNYPEQEWFNVEEPKPFVPYLCYGCATLVAMQRMYGNHHWASDVYFGALAGYFSGSLAVWLGERFKPQWLAYRPGYELTLCFSMPG